MIGDTCGDLTVIGESGRMSLVQCTCGTIRMIPTDWIKFKTATSCGCKNNISPKVRMIQNVTKDYSRQQYINPTGLRFGKLTVLYRDRTSGVHAWVCRCDCGNEIIVGKLDLFRRIVTDCGHCAEYLEKKKNKDNVPETKPEEKPQKLYGKSYWMYEKKKSVFGVLKNNKNRWVKIGTTSHINKQDLTKILDEIVIENPNAEISKMLSANGYSVLYSEKEVNNE